MDKNKQYKTSKGNFEYCFFLGIEVSSNSPVKTLMKIKLQEGTNVDQFLNKYFDDVYCDIDYNITTNTLNFMLDPLGLVAQEIETCFFPTIREAEKFAEKYIKYINPRVTLSLNCFHYIYLDEDENDCDSENDIVEKYDPKKGWIQVGE